MKGGPIGDCVPALVGWCVVLFGKYICRNGQSRNGPSPVVYDFREDRFSCHGTFAGKRQRSCFTHALYGPLDTRSFGCSALGRGGFGSCRLSNE
eukprot:scaffold1170_cov174-Amphora_coffeaeformis.AAC.3